MAALKRYLLAAVALGGCDSLNGFGGEVPPLVTVHLDIRGMLPANVIAPKVALIWAQSWLVEPLCIVPPDSPEAATAIAAGCRDPFGFVPDHVGTSVDVVPGEPIELTLSSLPAADVLVGGVTARVAYANLVLYDDRDQSGTLELSQPHRLGGREQGPPDEEQGDSRDVVHAASFVSMTEPDQRLAYREGAFVTTAYYPRAGCGDPLPAFSIDTAGGFSAAEAITATLAGTLPQEDPATCSQLAPAATTVHLAVRPPDEVREVACEERRADSSIRFREPPELAPDLTDRAVACTQLATFGMPSTMPQTQLVISGKPGECKGFTHYILRGCREDSECPLPDWDLSATPPAWWTCH